MSESLPLNVALSREAEEKSRKQKALSSMVYREISLLLHLAGPTVLIQLGFTLPQFWAASYVGRTFGSVYLDGFQLANLTMNLFTLSLLEGLYSAADTLSPQAYSAGNLGEVGLLAMRGFFGSLLLILPVAAVLMVRLNQALLWAGQDAAATQAAVTWYQVQATALPLYALYMVTWKFLSSQSVMLPLVIVALMNTLVVLPLALRGLTAWLGYVGAPWALWTFQACQAGFLLLYLYLFHPHKAGTWPGLSLATVKQALDPKGLSLYFTLGAGGMLASSEWVYWETMSLGIGSLGVVPLAVHVIPTQVLTIFFMIPSGLSTGLSIRLGATLPWNVPRAKQLTFWTFVIGTVTGGLVSIGVYLCKDPIVAIFSNDPAVVAGCASIWWRVCFFLFQIWIFVFNIGVITGLGMQWTLGVVTFVLLWGLSLPGAWYFGVHRAKTIEAVWDWIYPPYTVMNVILIATVLMKDWSKVSEEIRKREGIEDKQAEPCGVDSSNVAPTTYGTTAPPQLPAVAHGSTEDR